MNNWIWKLIILISLITLPGTRAKTQVIVDQPFSANLSLQGHLSFWVDSSRNTSFDSLPRHRFAPFPYESIRLTPQHEYWFSFQLVWIPKRDSLPLPDSMLRDSLLVLIYGENIEIGAFSKINFYAESKKDGIEDYVGGALTDLHDRAYPPNKFCFPIRLKPRDTVTCWVNVWDIDNVGSYPISISLISYDFEEQLGRTTRVNKIWWFALYGLFFGVEFLLLLLLLAQYFQTREKAFLYYFFYLSGICIYYLQRFEIGNFPVVFFSKYMSNYLCFEIITGYGYSIAYLLFISHLLNLSQNHLSFGKWIKIGVWVLGFGLSVNLAVLIWGDEYAAKIVRDIMWRGVFFLFGVAMVAVLAFRIRTSLSWFIMAGIIFFSLTHAFVLFTHMVPGTYDTDSLGLYRSYTVGKFTILMYQERIGILLETFCFFLGLSYTTYQRRLELEKKSAEADRIRAMDEFKTRFFTNITHEFRTPLTIILGKVDHLKENASGNIGIGLTLIQKNSNDLLRLVNQMLDLARLETGAWKLHPQPGDVVVFLRAVTESFDSLAKQRNLLLEFQADVPEPNVYFDPDALQKIVSNLASNAVKFTPGNGNILIRVSQAMASEKLRLLIEVQDNGEGISPDDLPFIFDRFHQTDSPQVRRHEGTGIGLALVKELVELMQGSIEVESAPSRGATFKVILPLEKSVALAGNTLPVMEIQDDILPADPVDIPEKKTTPSSLPSLLIVEDNVDVARHIADCVRAHYRPVFAANGREGIEQALKIVPDLILSDVMMPEADGLELTQTLKMDERTSHIPIVLLTARADIESRLKGLEVGADDYLPKPFDQQELRIRLRNLLTTRRRLQKRYSNPLLSPPLSADRALQREDAFVKKVRATMDAHLSIEGYGVAQLAKSLGMSRAALSRKWYALTDKDLGKLLTSIRLHHARQLIETTDATVAEAAYQSGFSDPAYFAKLFQKEFGVKPSSLK